MEINHPETLAEVTACFQAYERALVTNDLALLDGFFWESDFVLRYGVGENLYGIEAIRAFRSQRPAGDLDRTLVRQVVTTFGRDFATANAQYRRHKSGAEGRVSQTWVRLPEGWRIVAAHVSSIPVSAIPVSAG
ncbi:MAG: oxalurate catabolism protein HpxZ [Kiloniellaceae bacterium]